jgi:DNA-binding LacI/PurR family transcriptional regulator
LSLVTRRAGGPMYQQLRQDLLARIRRGEFSPGDLLPSENQLCDWYGVSVTTARRALLELVKEGIVYRKAGIGTMVAPKVRKIRLAFLSIDYKGDAWRRTPSALGEIVAGLGEECWQRTAAFSMTGVEGNEAVTYLRGLVEDRGVDGVLLRTADDIDEELLEVLEGAGMPYVVVKRHVPGRKMNCVVSDDVTGARIATNHLLDLGHRHIGFVCAKPHITFSQERLMGYRAALAERGIEPDAGLVRQQPYFTMEEGYRAVKDLLERSFPPEAIFVASDTMALGAYQAIGDLGLKVPDDVSVVGYDDISPAAVLQPPLTTVRTSYYDFGRLAAQLLLDIVEGRVVPPQKRTIEAVLVVRSSTRRCDPKGSLAVRRDELQVALRSPDSVNRGQLAGKVVAVAGRAGRMMGEMVRTCEGEGARVVNAREERIDALFYCFIPGADLGASVDRVSADVREILRAYPETKPGSVVCVALTDISAGGAPFAALRAGLGCMVGLLADDEGEGGVRVNAVMCVGGKPEDASGPAVFMALEETVNGQVLVVNRMAGAPSRAD